MLSTRTRYSIVALIDIAGDPAPGQDRQSAPMALSKIAAGHDLSLDYLEQLAVRWRRAGLVKGMRGPAGGYVLARPPGEITLADIAAAVGESVSAGGSDEAAALARQAGCPGQKICDFLTARMQAELAAITLADVAAGQIADAFSAAGEKAGGQNAAVSQPTV